MNTHLASLTRRWIYCAPERADLLAHHSICVRVVHARHGHVQYVHGLRLHGAKQAMEEDRMQDCAEDFLRVLTIYDLPLLDL
jgi:hypothetical protein